MVAKENCRDMLPQKTNCTKFKLRMHFKVLQPVHVSVFPKCFKQKNTRSREGLEAQTHSKKVDFIH